MNFALFFIFSFSTPLIWKMKIRKIEWKSYGLSQIDLTVFHIVGKINP